MSKTSVEDLQLLRQVVLYFLEFQKYHVSAVKLEKVAETFTKIAEAYVRHMFRRQSSQGSGGRFPVTNRTIMPVPMTSPFSPSTVGQEQEVLSAQSEGKASNAGMIDQMDFRLQLDETSSLDPTSLLKLFVYQGDDAAALEQLNLSESNIDAIGDLQQYNANQQRLNDWQPAQPGPYVSLRDVEMNARNQFSNCNFDWFALEDYSMQS